jgi:ribosomal protein S19
MGNLYNFSLRVIKNKQLNHFSPNIWRSVYLISTNQVYHTREKKIYGRNSTIPNVFVNHEILVYSGKKWHTRRVNKWMVGFKAGEFTWNRRYALFKAKQLRKKNKNKK